MKKDQTNIDFKADIELPQYAAFLGYELMEKESTARLTTMKNSSGDKIVIPQRKSNHWMYYSVTNDHRGTIFDLAINNNVGTRETVAKEIRAYALGDEIKPDIKSYSKEINTNPEADFKKLQNIYESCEKIQTHLYLTNKRLISSNTQKSDEFKNTFVMNKYGGVVFPQKKGDKITALEVKSNEYNGFLSGSRKHFWKSNTPNKVENIIINENPIDCMSYHEIKSPENALYIGISGGLSPEHKVEIANEIKKHPNAKITLAFDNDKAGLKYDEDFKEILTERHVSVVKPISKVGDWNAELKEIKQENGIDYTKTSEIEKDKDRAFYKEEALIKKDSDPTALNEHLKDKRNDNLEKRVYALKNNDGTPVIFANILTALGDKHSYRRKFTLLSAIDNGQETFKDIDLSNTPINKVEINKVVFERCDFSGSNLSAANFSKSKFIDCNFEGAKLNNSDFTKCLFENCNFSKAVLNESDLSKTQMINIALDNTEMNNIKAQGIQVKKEVTKEVTKSKSRAIF